LLKKFFTIVIVPRRTERVRKIRIRSFVFGLGALVFLGLLAIWIFVFIDYVRLQREIQDYDAIRQKYLAEEEQLKRFFERYEGLDLHFENLKAFNHKLVQMTRTRSDSPPETDQETDQKLDRKIELARKEGVLQVIAADASEVDSELRYNQETRFDNLIHFFRERPNPFTRIPAALPVKGYLMNVFGTSNDSFTGEITPQDGIDIATRAFQAVHAPADGIAAALTTDETYGNLLTIDHGNGFITRYGHLAKFEVEKGDLVRKGGIIAQAGNTGHTTRPRLHYEVLLNGIPQNPIKYDTD